MYEIIKSNWHKTKIIASFGIAITLLILIAVIYKSDNKGTGKPEVFITLDQKSDVINFKKFILNQIRSPFININYEITQGDTIQKILKKYKVKNREIQTVISEYKKFGKPNQLTLGKKVDIIIEKGTKESNSIIKFSIPITKSTTIEITKNEENKLTSKKIITKFYKRKTLAENIIKNNLYSSAIEAKINPDTIIEFARIFGFEIDFQRDIRKNDYFKFYMKNTLMKMEIL